MKAYLFAALVALLCVVPSTASATVRVVATLPTLAALAQDIGGDHVEVTVLASPNEDPHYVDARPDYILQLNKADLLIINGMELEIGWIGSLQTACRNADVSVGGKGYVDASVYVHPLDVPTTKVDRSQGDVHPSGNPHYLFDPRELSRVAAGIAEHLSELDPGNEEDYLANSDKVVSELEQFAREEAKRFGELPDTKRRFVAYHASLAYLANWLGLSEVATVEPRPGISPDPAHVTEVLSSMRSQGVNTIIQEAFYPTTTTNKLAQLAGAKVVVLEGGVDFEGGESLMDHFKKNTEAIYEALE